ncbi:MAG: hypothetical protein QUV35_05710 [Hydrogenophaga sp.]|uniref:hypothetical protein n=1 Tax=Hydrogenophaga sp. TaxID=1904254 RepID=UPI00262550D9|nr:hypothetical protein [Hydrogenophaga sp.]MDM7942107.1 hypothetical protein [Hydrogenophaga sp.]
MITKSTPWSITWTEDETHTNTFVGEWILEAKFYLVLPLRPCWDGSNTAIKRRHLKELFARFEREAEERNWVIVIEQTTGGKPRQQ